MSDQEFGEGDDLGFDFDLTGKKSDSDFGNKPIAVGKWHARLEKVEKGTMGDKAVIKFTFRVNTGPSENRQLVESLFLSDSGVERRQLWARRLGLIGDEQLNKSGVRGTWSQAIGRHVILEVEENRYKNKDGKEVVGSRVSYSGIWPISHVDVRDVPKNVQALAEDNVSLAPGSTPPPSASGAFDNV